MYSLLSFLNVSSVHFLISLVETDSTLLAIKQTGVWARTCLVSYDVINGIWDVMHLVQYILNNHLSPSMANL